MHGRSSILFKQKILKSFQVLIAAKFAINASIWRYLRILQ